MAPYRPHQNQQNTTRCILEQTIGTDNFKLLPTTTRTFRTTFVGEGTGRVTVQAGRGSRLFGLSASMRDKNFGAYVDTTFDPSSNSMVQKWTRVFNEGEKGASLYQTHFRATPSFESSGSGLVMTESIGTDFLRDLVRFGYDIKISDNKIYYTSVGLWLATIKLPIPRFLLPTSQWFE